MQSPKFWLWLLAIVLVAAPAQGQLSEVSVGLAQSHAGQGASWGDYDNDGDLDLYKVNNGADVLYENQGGTFVDVTAAAGISSPATGQAAVWGDYDNDGDLDLYVANYGSPNHLYRNQGNKTFMEVGASAGVDDSGNGASAAWIDYNRDGCLDLYVVNDNQSGGRNKFYRQKANHTFEEIGDSLRVDDAGRGVAVATGDYNNDGLPDMYLVNIYPPNRLYRNDGAKFCDVADSAGVDSFSGQASGAAWGDYNNNGNLDLFLQISQGGSNVLFQNNGAGIFTDVTIAAGVGDNEHYAHIGLGWADFDNDGDLDLYSGHENGYRLYSNNGNSTFADSGSSAYNPGNWNPRGATWGDVYPNGVGDGYLDIFQAHSGMPRGLFANNGGTNRWLVLKLIGTYSNRSAIGARVTAVTGALRQIREVDGSAGYRAQPSLPLEFGLGNTITVDSLIIQWPSGILQTLTGENSNQIRIVTEAGEPDIEPPMITLKPSVAMWPPNHKYQAFTIADLVASVTDACDADIAIGDVVIVSASSDEPEDAQGGGDGHTINDIVIASDGKSVQLRSERQGGGNGRVYTVNLAVKDASDNDVSASFKVTVPKSQNGQSAVDDGPVYTVNSGVSPKPEIAVPSAFALTQNRPNPFNPATEIAYDVPQQAHITLIVYNLLGQEVIRLVDEVKAPGQYSVVWNGRNGQGHGVSSGIYLYRIVSAGYAETRRMTLLK